MVIKLNESANSSIKVFAVLNTLGDYVTDVTFDEKKAKKICDINNKKMRNADSYNPEWDGEYYKVVEPTIDESDIETSIKNLLNNNLDFYNIR